MSLFLVKLDQHGPEQAVERQLLQFTVWTQLYHHHQWRPEQGRDHSSPWSAGPGLTIQIKTLELSGESGDTIRDQQTLDTRNTRCRNYYQEIEEF